MTEDRRRDGIPINAVRAAIDMLGRDYAPLARWRVVMSAHLAVWRALIVEPNASETALAALAHAALVVERNDARVSAVHRANLIGGIEKLPQRQQVILALKFEHGLSQAEIAAVLKLDAQEVKSHLAQAFEDLMWDGPQ